MYNVGELGRIVKDIRYQVVVNTCYYAP